MGHLSIGGTGSKGEWIEKGIFSVRILSCSGDDTFRIGGADHEIRLVADINVRGLYDMRLVDFLET